MSNISTCPACRLVFSTVSNFDRHRTGKYDITAPQYGRRCLTAQEMLALSWRQNAKSQWTRNEAWRPLPHS